eukprot:5063748-Prymnesium_polylepis.1
MAGRTCKAADPISLLSPAAVGWAASGWPNEPCGRCGSVRALASAAHAPLRNAIAPCAELRPWQTVGR